MDHLHKPVIPRRPPAAHLPREHLPGISDETDEDSSGQTVPKAHEAAGMCGANAEGKTRSPVHGPSSRFATRTGKLSRLPAARKPVPDRHPERQDAAI